MPRGPVRVSVRREAELIELAVPPGSWGVWVRPVLAATDAAELDAGLELERSGKVAEGQARIEALAARLADGGRLSGRALGAGARCGRAAGGPPMG